MTTILDRVAISNRARTTYTRFESETPHDVFALALARKLEDTAAAGHYARLCQKHTTDQLLHAFHKSMKAQDAEPRYRRFHSCLGTVKSNGGSNGRPRLAAIRVERRAVAIVIMHADNPEWLRVRQLSSVHDRAMTSAAYFISKTMDSFPITSAAMETIPDGYGHEYHRGQLSELVVSLLRDRAVSITQLRKQEVFEAFGYPPKRSRKEVRGLIERIYPFESFSGYGGPLLKDALALGLHIQTERLFFN